MHNSGMLILHAWRSWRSAKTVALLAAAALAAGIGSTTAIYTVVNAVMLKPLPYGSGERFVAVFSAAFNDPEHYGSITFDDARTYQQRTQSFDAFGWFRSAGQNLTFAGEPHHVEGALVTTSLVDQLGVEPALGRWFRDTAGVVISGSLWRRLGGDPDIVGKPLTLDGGSFIVTGVMPESFQLPVAGITSAGQRTDLWMALEGENEGNLGGAYVAYGRRKPGVTFEEAEADVKRVAAQIAADAPASHPSYTARVFDLRETVVKDIRPTLLLLFAAAGLLFLITCANAAGLLLARSVTRARETAMQVALGAGRGRLAAQYFAESLPVALAGALGGIVLSLTLTPGIVRLAADYLPRADEIAVDWTVLLFALGAAVLATGLASLAPLWQAVKTAPADALSDGARGSAGARSQRVSRSLVVAEIALAFALLATSGVLILHLGNLSRTRAGFDADNLLTFRLSVPGTIANDADKFRPHQRRLVEALQAIPGVGGVAFANQLPLAGCCWGTNIYPEGRPVDLSASQRMSLMITSPEYVRTMRIPLRRGRLLTERDLSDDLAFVVINQATARRYWGDQDPIGAYGRFLTPDGDRFQVVGIVGDVKNDGLGSPTVPEVHILNDLVRVDGMNFVVRSARPAAALLPEIRRVVQQIDPGQPIHEIATMREIIQRSTTLARVASVLTAFFAGAALLLAMLGVYGVVSYGVRQRTTEIGIRMAVGATDKNVLRLIVLGGLKLAAFGVIAGAVTAIGAAIYLRRVFDIPELGPAPFLYSTSIVGTVALVASFAPGWRAALLSPMVAMRNEPQSMWRAAGVKVRRVMRDLTQAPEAAVPMGALIAEFAGALRRAASFAEAADATLATLRERTGAQSIRLLQKSSDAYRDDDVSIPADGFLLNRLQRYPHPLPLTSDDFDAWQRWAREFKPQHAAEIERLAETGARIAVPLRTKNEIVGILLLGAPDGRDGYTPAEREMLASAADVFALMIENAGLTARAWEQEKLRRDLALAGEVQKRLLPPQPPPSGAVSLAAFTLPARTVGGDYYDFLDLGDDRMAIAVADVSGKGIAAALVMSVVQASLRVISRERHLPLTQLAERMNGFLYQSTGANKYATFFYAQIEERGRLLRYVNAGHNPPYLARCAGGGVEITELSTGGTVLGLFSEVAYEEAAVEIRQGDLLVAFTDGVTEALNSEQEEFGEERLKELLRGMIGTPADEISVRLANRMREWIGTAEQHDDLTFIVMAVQ
jgi:putative ABC transport system permease protein